MTRTCQNCHFRSEKLINGWAEKPSYACYNPKSFKHTRPVCKGMTCNKFTPRKEMEAAE